MLVPIAFGYKRPRDPSGRNGRAVASSHNQSIEVDWETSGASNYAMLAPIALGCLYPSHLGINDPGEVFPIRGQASPSGATPVGSPDPGNAHQERERAPRDEERGTRNFCSLVTGY